VEFQFYHYVRKFIARLEPNLSKKVVEGVPGIRGARKEVRVAQSQDVEENMKKLV
jgi:hypothetical protein